MTSRSELKIHVLGCGSAMPTRLHKPACQVVEHRSSLFMIDCGEGSQLRFREQQLSFGKLRHIFITHLHGDHCLGLPGLLATMGMHQQGAAVTIHMFQRGIDVFRPLLEVTSHDLPFPVIWQPLDPQGGETLVDSPALTVTSFKMNHKVPAVGFRFDEKPKPRHLLPEMLEFYQVGIAARASLKEGADLLLPDGRVIPNSRLTSDPTPSRSYAYASDTLPSAAVTEAVHDVDLLYHEATYTSDQAAKAHERGHSTAADAARIALKANAKRLMIGHYSKQYHSVEPLLDDARAIFPNTIAAQEGICINV